MLSRRFASSSSNVVAVHHQATTTALHFSSKLNFSTSHPASKYAYCVESKSDFESTCNQLEETVKRNKFGILHTHKVHEVLKNKGFEISEKAFIFDVCNPAKAKELLKVDMLISLTLPCQISVFTQDGKVKVAQLSPQTMMDIAFDLPAEKKEQVNAVAGDVTKVTQKIIDEACGVVEIPKE